MSDSVCQEGREGIESKIDRVLSMSYQTKGDIDRKIEALELKFMDLVNPDTKDDYRKLINSLRELTLRRQHPEKFLSEAQQNYNSYLEQQVHANRVSFRDLAYCLVITGDWDNLSEESKESIRCMFGVE